MLEVQVADKNANMYLYGPIYPDGFEGSENTDTITSKSVRDALNKLDADAKITVHINSRGGDVFAANAIKNILSEDKRIVATCVDGCAASGGSIVLQGCKLRLAYENSLILVHKGSTYAYGNAKGLREIADELDTVDKTVVANYMLRFNGTEEELHKILDEDKFMSAERAKELGFIDEILDEKSQSIQTAADDVYNATMNRLKTVSSFETEQQNTDADEALVQTKNEGVESSKVENGNTETFFEKFVRMM